MNEHTKRIVLRALDDALTLAVVHLFDVLTQANDDGGVDRFMLGLGRTVDLYEQLTGQLIPDIGENDALQDA